MVILIKNIHIFKWVITLGYNYEMFNQNKKREENSGGTLYKFIFTMIVKSLIAVILFLASMIYVKQSDINKEKFNKVVYQNSLSFAKIYNVYKKYLGDVIPFKSMFKDNTKVVSNEKIAYDKIVKKDNGYILTISSEYVVSSINDGIVIEKRNDKEYLNLIKIQDKNGLNITYGYLEDLNVKLYDYVEKGEILGKCNKKLYLLFEKDDKYLSYESYL